MKLVITESAVEDIVGGYDFYEKQEWGLGAYFRDALFAELDSLRFFAGMHPRVFGKYRLLAKHFPYAIFYELTEESILIRAVLDCRRNPVWIRRRLSLD